MEFNGPVLSFLKLLTYLDTALSQSVIIVVARPPVPGCEDISSRPERSSGYGE